MAKDSPFVSSDDELRAAIEDARVAADTLTTLQTKAARLPALENEAHRRDLKRRAVGQMERARTVTRAELDQAAEDLAAFRAKFVLWAAQAPALVDLLRKSQAHIEAAHGPMSHAVEAHVMAFSPAPTGNPGRDAVNARMGVLETFATEWETAGGTSARLLAFDSYDDRLVIELAHLISRLAGILYHPDNPPDR